MANRIELNSSMNCAKGLAGLGADVVTVVIAGLGLMMVRVLLKNGLFTSKKKGRLTTPLLFLLSL
jgi:hypothetical protein